MLPRITATRFGRAAEVGRTRPLVLFCDQEDVSEEIEVYVKLRGSAQIGATGLMCEGISALLGLPIPEPFAVEITERFATLSHQPENAELFRRSVGWNFGSRAQYPQIAVWCAENVMPLPMRPVAADAFAFDAMIQNPDRRHDHPNCGVRDESLLLFDHDLAFSFLSGVIGWRPPWEPNGLAFLANHLPTRHAFYDQLRRTPLDFARLIAAWDGVDAGRLSDYFESLPPEWIPTADARRQIMDYLLALKFNLEPTLAEVRKALR